MFKDMNDCVVIAKYFLKSKTKKTPCKDTLISSSDSEKKTWLIFAP